MNEIKPEILASLCVYDISDIHLSELYILQKIFFGKTNFTNDLWVIKSQLLGICRNFRHPFSWNY